MLKFQKGLGRTLILLLACIVAVLVSFLHPLPSARAQDSSGSVKPILVLSYPAFADESEYQQINEALSNARFPYCKKGMIGGCHDPVVDDLLGRVLTKSAYFVPDVLAYLEERHPNFKVVVQPASVTIAEGGKLDYLIPNPDLPAAVRIDFVAFIWPWDSAPFNYSTHGKHFTPLFEVRAGMGGDARTIGLSKGFKYELPRELNLQPSVFLRMLAQNEKGVKVPKGSVNWIDGNRAEISDDAWLHVTGNGSGDFVKYIVAEKLAEVSALIDNYSNYVTPPSELESLAAAYGVSKSKVDEADVQMLEIAQFEADFTREVANTDVQNTRATEFGASMRELLGAERELHKKARTMGIIGGLAMSVTGFANMKSTGSFFSPTMLMQSMATQNSINTLDANFDASVGGIEAEQREMTLTKGDENRTVAVSNLAELRAEIAEFFLGSVIVGPGEVVE